jgi:uncharacterized phage-associated protein
MAVEFKFNFPRSLAVITYIASKNVPELTTYKILKLIFLADKFHLVQHGRTITGDKYSALPDGPVPSRLYDFFKKQVLKNPFSSEGRQLRANLEIDKTGTYPRFKAKAAPDMDELSSTDVDAIDFAIKKFGAFSYGELKDLTHEMAAFEKAWKSKKPQAEMAPMKFEDFFEGDKHTVEAARAEMIESDLLRKEFA